MSDAMDIKESLGAHHVKAPTPPTGATKEERLKEAQAHLAAATAAGKVPPVSVVVPVASTMRSVPRTFKDPQFGHMVEETVLPTQAPGLSPAAQPAVASTGPRGAQPSPVVRQHELAKKDDPGNTALKGDLTTKHQPAAPAAKK
jgi:hypothetical protein